MRRNGNSVQKYILLLLAVVMLLLLQGCGVDPVPEWQIQADVMAFAPEWDPAATINSIMTTMFVHSTIRGNMTKRSRRICML